MIGDLLLAWMSETGTGTVSEFRKRAAWLGSTEGMELDGSSMNRWLRDGSWLGHFEVDWQRGRWAAAPPAIASLPLADGLAVLVGSRRPRLLSAISQAEIYTEEAAPPRLGHAIPGPQIILIPYESTDEVRSYASMMGISYAGCASSEIARLLRSIEPSALAAPPAHGSVVERLATVVPPVWRPVLGRMTNAPDGLYREQISGRWVYTFRSTGQWYACDLSSGVFAELARVGRNALFWRPDSAKAARAGSIVIDGSIPMPTLQARALTLCSGFPPRFDPNSKTAIYANVPYDVAARVAASLSQQLKKID